MSGVRGFRRGPNLVPEWCRDAPTSRKSVYAGCKNSRNYLRIWHLIHYIYIYMFLHEIFVTCNIKGNNEGFPCRKIGLFFRIELNVIVVRVLFSILNQMEFCLVQNRKDWKHFWIHLSPRPNHYEYWVQNRQYFKN